MRKLGLVLILSIIVISTFFIFYSINYPISDANSEKDRNLSEISYVQNDQPKISDSFEPNNNFSSAIEIAKGWHSLLDCNDDDWFKFWININEEFTIDIFFLHSMGDLDMELRDNSNGWLDGSYSVDDNETITWTAGYSGYYYIHIYNLTVGGNYYDLDIYINLLGDDGFEPNNYFSNAVEIGKGWYPSLMCKDDDWFKFWIEKDEEFTVEIFFPHSMGDLDMELYNNSNGWLDGSYSVDDNEMITWIANYSGFYYIHIYNYSFTIGNYYDLDIYIGWKWWDDEYEYNNDFWSAKEVFKGLHRHLKCQDEDWYMIHLFAGEDITVDIFFFNDSGNLDMELYNNTYGWLNGSYSWDDDETISFTASYTGYYFIFVNKYSFDDDNEYDMKISGQQITVFYEDFEGPISSSWSGVNEGNYMHVTSRDSSPESPFNSLWCGNEITGFYDKQINGSSIPYKESAIINDLDLRDYCYVELTFDVKLSVGFNFSDYASISVNLLGDEYYLSPKYTNCDFELGKGYENTGGWVNQTVDLSFFSGYELVDIIFNFGADEVDNYYEGVMIDNVRIKGIPDDEPIGYELGIHVGDEFYYYFPYIDQYSWTEIFDSGIHGFYDEFIKIEIMSINDMGSYWEVTSLFWDPWDDFEEFAGTDEIKYKIYKNPINMKDGADFFIPRGDMWRYFEKADNFDRDWT
ncbi:MAG: PPC domain-containing protein, partial [Candidatus Hodarchaeota archaeon]